MRREIEIGVGLFMLVGIFALAYLSVRLGQVDLFGAGGYTVYAHFPTVGGLKTGAIVEIAGVPVGRVDRIQLKDYQARVALHLNNSIQVQTTRSSRSRPRGSSARSSSRSARAAPRRSCRRTAASPRSRRPWIWRS